MADPNIGDELLKAAGIPVLSAQEQVARALARDQRRVKWLTRATVLLWVMAVLVVGFLLYGYHSAMQPRIKKMMDDLGISSAWSHGPLETPEQKNMVLNLAFIQALTYGLALLAAAVGVLAVAMLGTVLLVHATRRATLRQINASLQAISDQLRQLQAARG
jgi:hypothetical protein